MSKSFWLAYGCAALVFLLLDAIWLGYAARAFYRSQVGSLLLDPPRLGVAALFYVIYLLGIVYFCVLPGLAGGSGIPVALQAAKLGLLFGLIAYATYDLTNLATLKGWTNAMAAVDIVWGGVATAAASGVSAWVTKTLLA